MAQPAVFRGVNVLSTGCHQPDMRQVPACGRPPAAANCGWPTARPGAVHRPAPGAAPACASPVPRLVHRPACPRFSWASLWAVRVRPSQVPVSRGCALECLNKRQVFRPIPRPHHPCTGGAQAVHRLVHRPGGQAALPPRRWRSCPQPRLRQRETPGFSGLPGTRGALLMLLSESAGVACRRAVRASLRALPGVRHPRP